MSGISVYESLKNVDGYIDYSENIEFEYRYKYNFISDVEKRNYRNIVLKSLIEMYNGDRENIRFPETEYPVAAYVSSFVNSVRGIVSEEIIPKEWVEDFTKNTILNSENKKEVQIALALGEYFLVDNLVNEVGKVFSKSGSYILYDIGVIKRMKNYNTFLFNLIKNTDGVIKLYAAEYIEEIDISITNHMFNEGYKDKYYPEFMVGLVMNTFNRTAYLRRDDITDEEVNNFCKLFAENFKISGPELFVGEIDFLDTLLYKIEKQGNSIEALYSIIAIAEIILNDDSVEVDEEELIKGIRALASQQRFKDAVKDAFKEGNFEFSSLVIMAEEAGVDINFKMVKNYLDKNKYDLSIYKELLKKESSTNRVELVNYVEKNLDFSDIVGNMEGISLREERELNPKEKIFGLILVELRKIYPVGRELLKLGIKANSTRIRRANAKVLLKLKKQLPDEFVDYISSRFPMEIIPEVKKAYERIINRNVDKRLERISTNDIKVETTPKDVYILDSYIAGLAYKDREMLERELREDARLYMKRDCSNVYDAKAIKIVSKSGFVLGFVPKRDNEIISRLMDSGRYFYCIVDKVDMERLHVDIKIYLSYKDIMNEVSQVARAILSEPRDKKFN